MYAKNEVYRSKIKEKALFGWSLPLTCRIQKKGLHPGSPTIRVIENGHSCL